MAGTSKSGGAGTSPRGRTAAAPAKSSRASVAATSTKPRGEAPRKTATKKQRPSQEVQDRAARIASSLPLVHFPARISFDDWIATWPDLSSHAARGVLPIPSGEFPKLRYEHVFVYAGPSCYFSRDSIGDSILYFAPGAEDGRTGGATAFDSGSLEEPKPRLRPWASRSVQERWTFFVKRQVPLPGWRKRLERWLAASYDAPDRYLETLADR